MFERKVTKNPDGTKVVETKNTVKTKYPNGDFDIRDKKRGTTDRWRLTSEDDV
jgi:hypothetical protein